MTPAPERRWSYSLRTLFVVVTVAAMLVGWTSSNLNWVHQRHGFLGDGKPIWRLPNPRGQAPGVLWIFGEVGMVKIHIVMGNTKQLEARMDLASRLFPEAGIDGEIQ